MVGRKSQTAGNDNVLVIVHCDSILPRCLDVCFSVKSSGSVGILIASMSTVQVKREMREVVESGTHLILTVSIIVKP